MPWGKGWRNRSYGLSAQPNTELVFFFILLGENEKLGSVVMDLKGVRWHSDWYIVFYSINILFIIYLFRLFLKTISIKDEKPLTLCTLWYIINI
jgi:hypothetical protein